MDLAKSLGDRQKIVGGVILALLFSIPLPQKVSSIIVGLLILVSLASFFTRKESFRIPLQWFLPALFFYYLISELASGGSWGSIERRLLFLAIPLAFAAIATVFTKAMKTKAFWSFILGNVFVVVLCLGNAVFRSIVVEEGQVHFNPMVMQDPTKDFLASSVFGGNYFFGHDFSMFHDPMYFGLYIVFAQCLIFEIVKTSDSRREKMWLTGCYFLLWGALFLLSSKAAIISSLLFSMYIAGYVFFKVQASSFVRWGTIAGLMIIGALFISFNPRLKLFRETFWERLSINPNARFGHDLRILSWDASLEIIKSNVLIGVGEGKKQEALTEVYNAKGYVFPARDSLNSHNQYLDFLLGGGLVAFGLFMTGFIQVGLRSIKERNEILLAFCLLFAFHALVENFLSRYAGILVFTIFISLLGTRNKEVDKEMQDIGA